VLDVSNRRTGVPEPAVTSDTEASVSRRLCVGPLNDCLRAFDFALAALSWFLRPWLFVLASALVAHVLYRRKFHSKALHAPTRPRSLTQSLHLPQRMPAELGLGARSTRVGDQSRQG
jgi:hypothetical protein